MLKRFKSWINADDVSNDMGGGCLVAAGRFFMLLVLITIIIGITVKHLL